MNDIVDELREIQRMNTTLHGAQMAARAADEIERLREERDEARRDLCYSNEWRACPYEVARKKATECGWDCFKEKP